MPDAKNFSLFVLFTVPGIALMLATYFPLVYFWTTSDFYENIAQQNEAAQIFFTLIYILVALLAFTIPILTFATILADYVGGYRKTKSAAFTFLTSVVLISLSALNYNMLESTAFTVFTIVASVLVNFGVILLYLTESGSNGKKPESTPTQESPEFTVKSNKTNSFIYLEKPGVKNNFLQFFEYNKFLASIAHNNVNNYALINVETFNDDLKHLVNETMPKLENPHENSAHIVNTASTNAKNVINALYEVSERKNISDEKRAELNDKLHNKLNDSLIDFMQETVTMYKIQRIEQETQAENIVNNVVI